MLLWIDGFESYGTTDDAIPAPTGVLRRRYLEDKDGTSSSYTQIKAGRLSGHCLWLSVDDITTPTLTDDDTLIVGFAFKITDIGNYNICQLLGSDGENFDIKINGSDLSLIRGTTVLGTTTGLGLVIDIWYWLELKVKCDDTVGTYELRIGEADVLSATGVDTKDGTGLYTKVLLGSPSSALDICYDDFYICDGSGTANNDFIGGCYVTAIKPGSAGTNNELTPSAGGNYDCVNEAIIDDDTSYVEGDAGVDTYHYDDVTAMEEVIGIQINTQCREVGASSFGVKTVTRIGSTNYTDAEQAVGTTGYVNKHTIKETNPATSLAWTVSDINSTEFGVEVV